MWVETFYPLSFLQIFPKWLLIFKWNFTRLFYVHTYAILQNFIELSITLTKLCPVNCNHPVSVYISLFHCLQVMANRRISSSAFEACHHKIFYPLLIVTQSTVFTSCHSNASTRPYCLLMLHVMCCVWQMQRLDVLIAKECESHNAQKGPFPWGIHAPIQYMILWANPSPQLKWHLLKACAT